MIVMCFEFLMLKSSHSCVFSKEKRIARQPRAVLLFLASTFALLLQACGGSSSGGPRSSAVVTLTPKAGLSLFEGQNLNVVAQVDNDASETGVLWTLEGDGSLLNPTPFGVTYVAPSTTISDPHVVVTATSLANAEASAYIPITLLPQNTLANVQPLHVDGGPIAGKIKPNTAFTSVTVCVPGTIVCNQIDGIIVDTGSIGLRILSSALSSLPAVKVAGSPVIECEKYGRNSFLLGNVVLADVKIAGEVARAIPIQALGAAGNLTVPSDCSDGAARVDASTQSALGANGILGLGYQRQDCGTSCASGTSATTSFYYSCSDGSCSSSAMPLSQQVINPVTSFLIDNNGVVLQIAGLEGAASRLDGSITFGIATATNNQLGNSTIFTVDSQGKFTTTLSSTGQNLTASVISSGLNALYFPDDSLTSCGGQGSFYCPPSSTAVASMQVGVNGAQGAIQFNVENADTLLANNPQAAALSGIAGSNGTGGCSDGAGSCQFEWGLPFFYGRTVSVAITGQPLPDGVPAGPWFAYSTKF
jgi:hypothetical protein